MPEAPEHIRKTLDDFKQQLAPKMVEVMRVLSVVNALEDQLGLPKTSILSLTGGGFAWTQSPHREEVGVDSPSVVSPANIRPDDYLGDMPLGAAKKYLRRVRRAADLDEIAEAISKGGAAIKGTDWKADLDASLLRSTREVVKVREETYGLVEFYTEEQLRGLRATRRQRQEPVRKRGRPRKKGGRKRQKEGAPQNSQRGEGGG